MIKRILRAFKRTNTYHTMVAKWKHLKDCFTTIQPSENNMYFRVDKRGPQYQCMDCSSIFSITYQPYVIEGTNGSNHPIITHVPPQCPCGSRAYFPMDTAISSKRPAERIERNPA